MTDYKDRVRKAVETHHAKALKDSQPKESKARNGKPEKIVERDCMRLMREWGWSVQILEAKATWSTTQEKWIQKGMKAGTCDCLGSTEQGIGVAVEFKAPGSISSFNSPKRALQKKFILDKIHANNFACVVDSAVRLEFLYREWLKRRAVGLIEAREFLLASLPVMRPRGDDSGDLFDDL